MFWDRGEKSELPDLPPLKPILEDQAHPFLKKEEEERPPAKLPTFPESPIKKGFSQAAIKEAVKEEKMPELPERKEPVTMELPETSLIPKPIEVEMEEMEVPAPPAPTAVPPAPIAAPPAPTAVPPAPKMPVTPTPPKTVHVFVQINKFHSAYKSLITAQEKLHDIDSLLKKIRETRMREEQELSAWEKELTSVKSKIQGVTENIFEKMDVV